MTYSRQYLDEAIEIINKINDDNIEEMAKILLEVRNNQGRAFFLGVGGSAGNCSHAVNDFRKICNIEAYTPSDNVAELTARINDEGWETSMSEWLKVSKMSKKDALFVFSVGGGNKKKKVSTNLISAIDYAKKNGSKVFGVVGKKGGYLEKHGNCTILIPEVDKKKVTPLSEAYQAVIWHCLVSHPKLQIKKNKW